MVEIKFNEIIEIHFSHLFLCLVKLAKLKFEINHQNDPKIFYVIQSDWSDCSETFESLSEFYFLVKFFNLQLRGKPA